MHITRLFFRRGLLLNAGESTRADAPVMGEKNRKRKRKHAETRTEDLLEVECSFVPGLERSALCFSCLYLCFLLSSRVPLILSLSCGCISPWSTTPPPWLLLLILVTKLTYDNTEPTMDKWGSSWTDPLTHTRGGQGVPPVNKHTFNQTVVCQSNIQAVRSCVVFFHIGM